VSGLKHDNITAVEWFILHGQNPLLSATLLVMAHVWVFLFQEPKKKALRSVPIIFLAPCEICASEIALRRFLDLSYMSQCGLGSVDVIGRWTLTTLLIKAPLWFDLV